MSCGKIKYKDKIAAMMALISCLHARYRKNKKRNETRIYFCKECNAWHLTSNNKK